MEGCRYTVVGMAGWMGIGCARFRLYWAADVRNEDNEYTGPLWYENVARRKNLSVRFKEISSVCAKQFSVICNAKSSGFIGILYA